MRSRCGPGFNGDVGRAPAIALQKKNLPPEFSAITNFLTPNPMKTIFFSIVFSISVFSATAQSYDSLDINNIHAGFNAAGDMFYNINTGTGHITTPGNKILYSVGNQNFIS